MVWTTPFGFPVEPEVYITGVSLPKGPSLDEMTHIENEEWVLRGHNFRRAVARNLCDFLVPPLVAASSPRNLSAGAPQNENVLDKRAFLDRGICNCLGGDSFASTATLVGGNENARLAILCTITEGLGGETRKDD